MRLLSSPRAAPPWAIQRDGVALLQSNQVAGLGDPVVLEKENGGVRAERQRAQDPVVGARVSAGPAEPAEVHHHGQRSPLIVGGPDNAHPNPPMRARGPRDPLPVRVRVSGQAAPEEKS
jgi:hypothetical protein